MTQPSNDVVIVIDPENQDGDDDLFVEALQGRSRLGYAHCSVTGRRLKIDDIVIEPAARGHGVRTALLNRVIAEAKSRGLVEIWGSVVRGDIDVCPQLLGWYQTNGFEVGPPNDPDFNLAEYGVRLRL